MAETTIEWTSGPRGELGYTFNAWIGCTKVGPGCDNCYAEAQDKHRRWTPEGWGAGKPRHRTRNWTGPVRWNRDAAAAGERRKVFCSSLADVFDNEVPDSWRADLWKLIEATPNLDWLLLTKRIGNVMSMIPEAWALNRLPRNVWLGATMVNQEERDRDMRKLLVVPASVHFLSLEPLLGPITLDLPRGHAGQSLIDWVIVGGESGPKSRAFDLTWAESLVDQGKAAGVPVFVKQLGDNPCRTDGSVIEVRDHGRKGKDMATWPEALRVREFPEAP